jgi:hypothetical protein
MGNEIIKVTARDPVALGQVLAQSGYFSDAKQAAQAAVKVMAGEELGLGPVASMTGIHLVQGKVTVGANLLAALVRNHPDYDYEVREHTEQVCVIEFTYKGKPAGTSSFSMEDAQRAGLTKNTTWKSYPKAMLYARAISQGVRWYCPNAASGTPVYTPDELGAEVQMDDGGEIVAVRVEQPEAPAPQPEPAVQIEAPADEYDPKAIIETLKDTFGAEVVKDAFSKAEITTFSQLTPDKAEAIREQLSMEAVA